MGILNKESKDNLSLMKNRLLVREPYGVVLGPRLGSFLLRFKVSVDIALGKALITSHGNVYAQDICLDMKGRPFIAVGSFLVYLTAEPSNVYAPRMLWMLVPMFVPLSILLFLSVQNATFLPIMQTWVSTGLLVSVCFAFMPMSRYLRISLGLVAPLALVGALLYGLLLVLVFLVQHRDDIYVAFRNKTRAIDSHLKIKV